LVHGKDFWNGIVITLFGRGLFFGIVIPIGITIPLRRGISIPLKNERNIHVKCALYFN
jgi:hypothetical protein